MSIPVFEHKRIKLFVLLVLVWQAAVLSKVFYLKVFKSDYYLQRARGQKEDIIDVSAPRGRILDRTLQPLAVSVPYDSLYAYTPNVVDKARTATELARVLGMGRDEVLSKLGPNPKFRYIKRFITPEERDRVVALKLEGLGFIRESKRTYPNQTLAAHVIGAVSFASGREVGLEGVERYYDRELDGVAGRMFIMRDGMSNILTTSMIKPAVPGRDLVLTIDSEIQHIVQRELESAMKTNGAKSGMVVVMDPWDGRVLAMAAAPSFDPNSLKEADLARLRNTTIESYFEPGSTFKIVATSGAIQENIARPDEVIHCGNGSITLNGHTIRDHHAFGALSFPEILANSSDVGAIRLGMRLGNERMYGYIRKFGFGEKTGIDLPSEIPGFVANPRRWSGISIGAISMGQEVGVTALQVARAMGVIANGGYKVQPRIVDRVLDADGRLVQAAEGVRTTVISERNAAVIREALCSVVEKGTGKRAAIPGFRVAGKTGTAQKFDFERHCYSPTEFVASFVGFAPAEKPAFVMAVVFDAPRPYHGGEAAAPVFSAVGRQILIHMRIHPNQPITAPPAPAKKESRKAPPADLVDFKPPAAPTGPDGVAPASAQTVYFTEDTVAVPDFRGKSVRGALQDCVRSRLVLRPEGSGQAVAQKPAPGARVMAGTPCEVRFAVSPTAKPPAPAPASTPGAKAARSGKEKAVKPAPKKPGAVLARR